MNYPQQGLVAANDERYITPTKTVCYVRMIAGNWVELEKAKALSVLRGWNIKDVDRIIVREELV